MKPFDVVVIGSCMIDLVCYAPRLPKSGETIYGTQFCLGHGGKGANQCVAAAKLGATTCLIARLGEDSFGKEYLKSLSEHGVHLQNVILTPNTSSGMAQITVSENGENHIVIVPGANSFLSIEDVKKAQDALLGAKVVIFQFETPLATTIEALKYIKQQFNEQPFTIVNGAPAIENVIEEVLSLCDIFCVNETEAEAITGENVNSVENAFAAIEGLLKLGSSTVIITLGSKGVVFGSKDSHCEFVPVSAVKSVDSTGAGDAFIGALGYFTSKFKNISLKERIRRSCVVASESVMHKGTQSSFPKRHNLPAELFLPS